MKLTVTNIYDQEVDETPFDFRKAMKGNREIKAKSNITMDVVTFSVLTKHFVKMTCEEDGSSTTINMADLVKQCNRGRWELVK